MGKQHFAKPGHSYEPRCSGCRSSCCGHRAPTLLPHPFSLRMAMPWCSPWSAGSIPEVVWAWRLTGNVTEPSTGVRGCPSQGLSSVLGKHRHVLPLVPCSSSGSCHCPFCRDPQPQPLSPSGSTQQDTLLDTTPSRKA